MLIESNIKGSISLAHGTRFDEVPSSTGVSIYSVRNGYSIGVDMSSKALFDY